MKAPVFLSVITLLFLFSSCALENSISTEHPPIKRTTKEKPTEMVNKALMLQLVNEVRQKGCKCGDQYFSPAAPLLWNDQLEQAALTHSTDMFKNNYFSHVSGDGSNGGARIDKAGYKWRTYGENIGMGYKSEKDVVDGWVKSPGHCKNIMNKMFKEVGVARVGTYWTQDFGAK